MMKTQRQLAANRANAEKSTGPRTDAGKAVAKLNALSHGLRSASPVVPGERPEEWEVFRDGIAATLGPVGELEAELADRVASLAWRLRRVTAYETGVTSTAVSRATAKARGEDDEGDFTGYLGLPRRTADRTYAECSKQLDAARDNAASAEGFRDQFRRLRELPADHPIDGGEAFTLLREAAAYTPNGDDEPVDIEDEEFLAGIGVPEGWRAEPDWWDGWTAGLVLAGVRVVAAEEGMTADDLLDRAILETTLTADRERRKAARLEVEFSELVEKCAVAEDAARQRALVPGADTLDRVMRYEGHLARQLSQTLNTLERLQMTRAGTPSTPPVALVTVDARQSVLPTGG
jgi:hypothetical protein